MLIQIKKDTVEISFKDGFPTNPLPNEKKKMDFLESQKGVLRVSMGEWSKEIDIPFNNSLVLGKPREFFNLGELTLASKSDISNPDELIVL